MQTGKNSVRVLVFNALSILAIFAIFEGLARLFLSYNTPFDERLGYNLQHQPSGYVRYFSQPNQILYRMHDGRIMYDQVRYRINRYGYRGEDFPIQKEPGEIRIVVLGGSHVFDLHAYDYEQRPGFPRLIQDALRQDGYPVHVINAGLPGHDTRDFPAKVLLDLRRYAPDIIVVSSIWNDTKWISHASESTLFLTEAPQALQKNPMVEKVNSLDRILGFSVFYRKARDLYWQKKLDLGQNDRINEGIARSKNPEIKNFARGLDQYQANLVGLIQMIRTIGATPVLAVEERLISTDNSHVEKEKIQYHVVNVNSHDELVRLYQQCDDILAAVAHQLEVPLIDIHEEMEGKLEYFRDHVHTTPLGSELIAERYTDFLKPLVKQLHQQNMQPVSGRAPSPTGAASDA